MIYKLDEMLLAILGSESMVKAWWDSPNIYFALDTPEQAFRSNPHNVIAYISRMTNG